MQRQWLVTLQNLPAAGRSWDIDVPRRVLQDEQFGSVNVVSDLCGDVHWNVSLEHTGQLYRLCGEWRAVIARECSRCNAAFSWQVTGQTERQFQLGREPVDDESGVDCEYIAPPGEVNLVDVLREDIWLAWKADVICSETCKGLCQGCGSNLNSEACKCKRDESDHPFAALRNLKLDG
ncbi:Uncharacterized metal-binding protein YceD, DUF177 family [Mariprofundus ferrinatatus]|uniref:Uncharacterized metal-binding protein YceD, DUF177 family n=1 Tax=Mariprofundus ferrinatatus TaxID=1921087 RepID=A0A2K8L7V4_9PROT|nr:DUF177 domain-containing protein [Mariprofundus ferrinatatus]ATX82329.1 Uncharacterized metal-binding protein YceD, DUF177 family [Mariprofundus ferrinatatus]